MFCGNCGAKNENGAAFCHQCGAALTPAAQSAPGVPAGAGAGTVAAKPGMSNTKKGIIAVIAAAVVVVLVFFLIFGGNSPEDTVNGFFDACFDGDAEALLDLLPPDMIDTVLEDSDYGYDGDRDALIDDLESEVGLSYLADMLENDVKIDYEILGDSNLPKDEVEDLQDQYEDFNVKVSDAKTVQVSMTIEYDDMSESTEMDIPLIKVGRSWYLDVGGF